jgi:predicted DNA-binding protein
MDKIRFNIYLNKQQLEQLQKLSAKTGAPVAELVRRAVDKFLKTA